MFVTSSLLFNENNIVFRTGVFKHNKVIIRQNEGRQNDSRVNDHRQNDNRQNDKRGNDVNKWTLD
jgi:hypothetical protein